MPQLDFAAWTQTTLQVNSGGKIESVPSALVSSNGFRVLQLKPAIGHLFDVSQDQGEGLSGYPVVLTYSFWDSRYAHDTAVVGKTILVNGQPAYIAGVLEPGFRSLTPPHAAGLILPLEFERFIHNSKPWMLSPQYLWLTTVARLTDGMALTGVNQWLKEIDASLRSTTDPTSDYLPDKQLGSALIARSARIGRSDLEKRYREPLFVLEGTSVALFLICSVNVALLFVGRNIKKARETAVRIALGAGRLRIAGAAAIEVLLLCFVGALLAIPISVVLTNTLSRWLMAGYTSVWLRPQHPDMKLILSGIGLALFVALVACTSIIVSLQLSIKAPTLNLGIASGRTNLFIGKAIIAAEIGFALILITAGILGSYGFWKLESTPSGFADDSTLIAEIVLTPPGVDGQTPGTSNAAVAERIIERIRSVAGADKVSFLSTIPLTGADSSQSLTALRDDGSSREIVIWPEAVDIDYFNAIGTRIIRGRAFNSEDRSANNCVISASVAQEFWGGKFALGDNLYLPAHHGIASSPFCRVIGVAQDTHFRSMKADPDRVVYTINKQPVSWVLSLAIQTYQAVATSREITQVVKELAPMSQATSIHAIRELVQQDTQVERVLTSLACFSAIISAIILGGGVFAVIALEVAQYRRVLALRLALGAPAADIVHAASKRFYPAIFFGLVVGSMLTFSRLHDFAALYGLKVELGFLSVSASIVFICVITVLGSLPPLWQLFRRSPWQELRHE